MTRPSVVCAALASASSTKERPNEVNVANDAVPEPVKYGNLSAALVSPAIAASSTSYPWTFVPIARPRLLRAVAESVAPVPPLAIAIAVPFHVPIVIVPTEVKLELTTVELSDVPVSVPAAAVTVCDPALVNDIDVPLREILEFVNEIVGLEPSDGV
jgi:hypothetical protein